MTENPIARKRKAIEVALRRRSGASQAHAARVSQHMMAQSDLRATCRKCGASLYGTFEDLRSHVCHKDGKE